MQEKGFLGPLPAQRGSPMPVQVMVGFETQFPEDSLCSWVGRGGRGSGPTRQDSSCRQSLKLPGLALDPM